MKSGWDKWVLAAALSMTVSMGEFSPAYGVVGQSFSKITDLTDLGAGNYVITGVKTNGEEYAMLNQVTATGTRYILRQETAVTIEVGMIQGPDESIVWTLAQDGDYWTIYNAGAGYVGYSGSGNTAYFESEPSDKSRWTISVSNGLFVIENVGVPGRRLKYNISSPRFSCYSSSMSTCSDLSLYAGDLAGMQRITFPAIGTQFVGAELELTAEASSGLPITYSVTGPATLEGNILRCTGVGWITVTARQDGNESYSAAEEIRRFQCVDPQSAFFTKISTGSELVEGSYVITGKGTDGNEYAMSGQLSTTTTKYILRQEEAVSVQDGMLQVQDHSIVWTLAKDGDHWTLYHDQAGYAGYPGSGNSAYFETSPSDKSRWNISASNGLFAIDNVAVPGRRLTYNTSSPRFACYSSTFPDLGLYWGGSLAAQRITFPSIGTQLIGATVELTAEASSGLPVTYAVAGPATLEGNMLTCTGAGKVTVVASQSGDETWAAASDVTIFFLVHQLPQTIEFPAISRLLVGKTITLTATASSGLPVTFSATGPATLEGNELTCTKAGVVTVTASQAGNDTYVAAETKQKIFAVDPANPAFVKLADAADLEEGQYVITGTGTNNEEYAMLGETATSGRSYILRMEEPVAIENNEIHDADDAIVWTMEQVDGHWTIHNAGAGYAGYSGNYNSADLYSGPSDRTCWDITGSNGLFAVENVGTPGWVLKYNVGSPRFACYSTEMSSLQHLSLYWGINTSQRIKFPPVGAQIAGSTVTLGAVASSGLPVTYAVTGPAFLDGNVLSCTGVGTVRITASQAGDETWNAARDVTVTIAVLDEATSLHTGRVTENETWNAGQVHVVDGTLTIAAGAVLTIEPGTVVKFTAGSALSIESEGCCIAGGVVFTHIADDTVGGDTLMDGGATQPESDQYGVAGNLETDEATEMRWLTLKTAGTLSGENTWMGHRTYRVTGNLTVASGATLNILPGAVVKFDAGVSLTVNSGGTLNAIGTRAAPIVFTSVKDDEHGGDTNGDGDATMAQPGDWARICAGGTLNMDYCRIRYCNNASDNGAIQGTGGTVKFDNGVIEYSVYECVRMNSGRFESRNSVFREASMGFGYYGGSGVYVYNGVVADCTIACRASNKHFFNTVFYRCQTFLESASSSCDHCVFFNPAGYGAQSAAQVGSNGNKWGNPLFVDPDNGDFRILEASPCVDAGNGTVAPAEDWYGAPRQTVRAEGTGTAAENGQLPDIGLHEWQPRDAGSDVDLAAVSVSAEAFAVSVGGKLAVSWTVENRGTANVSAPWRDAVELIAASGAVVALGEATSPGLASGGQRTVSGSFTVPAMEPGEARLRVRVNPHRDVYEGVLTGNNTAFAESAVEVRLPDFDATASGTVSLAAGGSVAFRIPPESGTTALRIDGTGELAAYAAADGVPSALVNDAAGETLADGSVLLVLPADAADTAYNFVLANGGSGGAVCRIEPLSSVLSVLEASPGRLANTGTGYLTLVGVGMDRVSDIRLEGGRTVSAGEWRAASPARIDAAFELSGAAVGTYTVILTDADGTLHRTDASVAVYKPTEGAKLEAWLEVPSNVREGRICSGAIHYANTGDEDLIAPLLELDFSGTAVRLPGEEDWQTEALYVMGVSGMDPAGVLPAGGEGKIVFEFKAGASPRFSLKTENDDREWWTEKRAVLSAAATRVARRGRTVVRWAQLEQYADLFAAGTNAQAVCGVFSDARNGRPLSGVRIVATGEDGATVASDTVDETGIFVLEGLQGETNLVLYAASGAFANGLTIEVPASGDVLDLVWTGVAGNAISIGFTGVEGGDWENGIAVELVHAESGRQYAGVFHAADEAVFSVRETGLYRLTAVLRDGYEAETSVEVAEGTASATVAVAFAGGTASGSVADASGAPVAGAIVTVVRDGDPSFEHVATSREDGRWTVGCLPEGSYSASVAADGFGPGGPVAFTLAADGMVGGVGLTLSRYTNSIAFSVPKTFAGGTALFEMRTGDMATPVVVASDGMIHFENLPEGVGTLRIYDTVGGILAVLPDVLVKAGDNERTLAATASDTVVFAGEAKDENGHPVQANWMILTAQADGVRATSDEEGVVAVELRKADYWGQVSAPGFLDGTFHVRLDDHVRVRVVLQRGGHLAHILPGGIDAASVRMVFASDTASATAGAGNGREWISGVLPAGETGRGFVVHAKGAYFTDSAILGAGTTGHVARASGGRPLRIRFGDAASVAAVQLDLQDGSGFTAKYGVAGRELSLTEFPAVALRAKAYSVDGSLVAETDVAANATELTLGADSLTTVAGVVTGGKVGQCTGGTIAFCTADGKALAAARLSASGAFRSAAVPGRFVRVWVALADGTAFSYAKSEAEALNWLLPIPGSLRETQAEVTDEDGIPLAGFPVVVTFGDGYQTSGMTDSNGRLRIQSDSPVTISGMDGHVVAQTDSGSASPTVCATCGRNPCVCKVANPCPACGADPCICKVETANEKVNDDQTTVEVVSDPVQLPPVRQGEVQAIHYHDWTLRESLWFDPLVEHLAMLRERMNEVTLSAPPRVCPDPDCTFCQARFGAYNRAVWNRYRQWRMAQTKMASMLEGELNDLQRISRIRHNQQLVGTIKVIAVTGITIGTGGAGGAIAAFVVSTGDDYWQARQDALVGDSPSLMSDEASMFFNWELNMISALDEYHTPGGTAVGHVADGIGIALDVANQAYRWHSFDQMMNARIRAMDANLARFSALNSAVASAASTPYKVCDMAFDHCLDFYSKKCKCDEKSSPYMYKASQTHRGPPDAAPSVPTSCDPNEMSGPTGVGEMRLVGPGEWMTYTVYFENKEDATVAAQEVRVGLVLDPALDWSTFEFGEVVFGEQLDNGLHGKKRGTSEVQMEGTNYWVRTETGFDEGTGAATWYLRIVDRTTADKWPRDVYAGILPPNDAETHCGEGHLTYRVKVREDAAEGVVVRASASIVFDYNEAIETNPAWWNTVTRAKVQEIAFPEIGPQTATDTVELWAVASSGLPVSYAVEGPAVLEGSVLRFTGTGTVTVTARQDGEGDWEAAEPVSVSFAVGKAAAVVTLGGLEQVFDGNTHAVTVETVPTNLAVVVTYDGAEGKPTNAGRYAVAAAVDDAIWEGSAEGVLVVAKGNQSIVFPTIAPQDWTDTVVLGAVASSGLAVDYEVVAGPGAVEGNVLSFTGAGTVVVRASQAGDGNWEAAASVEREVEVTGWVTLRVESAHGVANPAAGVHEVVLGTGVEASVAGSPAVLGEGWRAVCTGWRLEGDGVAASGEGTSAAFTATADAVLTWLWETQALVRAEGLAHGTAEGGGWYAVGATATLKAVPEAGHSFTGWEGDFGGSRANPLAVAVRGPGLAVATFYTTYYAREDGSDGGSGLSWGAAKREISAALAEAAWGDAVVASNGTYGAVTVPEGVTVRSVEGAEVTAIRGGTGVRCVEAEAGAVVEGFALEGADVEGDGGGARLAEGAELRRCIVRGNRASGAGGGVFGGGLENCLLEGNSAAAGGGASGAELRHCTLVRNSGGGAKDCRTLNSVFWENGGEDVSGGTTSWSRCSPLATGTGNIEEEPCFAGEGNWRLAYESPCIDAAGESGTAEDLEGSPRPQPKVYGGELKADMGCYEYVPKARFVWEKGSGTPPYESWKDAARDIQSALDVSGSGDRIVVEAGTYGAVTVSNAVILMGYRGAAETVIDGRGSERAVTMGGGGVLEGFTIRNGASEDCGGILADGGATVRDVVVEDCRATGAEGVGGGLCLYGGSVAENVTASGNAAAYGGGVWAAETSAVVRCELRGNAASAWGGGAWLGGESRMEGSVASDNTAVRGAGVYGEDCEIADSEMRGNTATGAGGGAAVARGTFRNNALEGNRAANGGGLFAQNTDGHDCLVIGNAAPRGAGVWMEGDGQLWNFTVADNEGPGAGVALRGTTLLGNTIAWGNAGGNIDAASGTVVRHSCAEPVPEGEGNFAEEPAFVGGGDYHLRAGSPCVDAGMVQEWMSEAYDFDGQRRVMTGEEGDGRDIWVDVGTDEAAQDAVSAPTPDEPRWTWRVVMDARLQLQSATNLLDGASWADDGAAFTATNQTWTLDEQFDGKGKQFYRLLWLKD